MNFDIWYLISMIFDDFWWCLMMFLYHFDILMCCYCPIKTSSGPCPAAWHCLASGGILPCTSPSSPRQLRLWKSCIHCIHHWSFSREQWTSRGWVQSADLSRNVANLDLLDGLESRRVSSSWQGRNFLFLCLASSCSEQWGWMAKHTCKIIWTYFALQKVSKVNMRKQNLNESDAICGHFSLAIATVQVVPLQLSLDFLQESESSCGTLLGLKGYAPEAILDDVGYLSAYARQPARGPCWGEMGQSSWEQDLRAMLPHLEAMLAMLAHLGAMLARLGA